MSKDKLRNELERLHQALAKVEELDEQTVAAMKQVTDDIDHLLESDKTENVQDVRQRVDDLILKFETDHPKITNILSQVTDILASVGI